MEFLNQKSTIVFATLMDNVNDKGYLKIENEPYMPLTIERIGKGIGSPWGLLTLYSLCHYFTLGGDLMQDPEMCFMVADDRQGFRSDYKKLKVAPYFFQSSPTGTYDESVRMSDNRLTTFNRKLQKDHTAFANIWLTNIRMQGFIKNISNQ